MGSLTSKEFSTSLPHVIGKGEEESEEESEESEEEIPPAVDPRQYNLPFTNLVLCGGGVKGVAHFGAAKYLEEIGVLPNIKRFAGTSIGSLFAALYAAGLTYEDIHEMYTVDLERLVYDGSWFYYLSNLLNRYGCHPMNRLENMVNEMIKKKTGIDNITFCQLYRRTGNELCVVVCNLTNMNGEYFHPKTTPDVPVATAVRMSMTIPGWYLSMEKENNFFTRLNMTNSSELARAFHDRFKTEAVNLKTLGFNFHVVGEEETEMDSRSRTKPWPRKPKKNTRLYRATKSVENKDKQAMRQHKQLITSASVFMHVLSKNVGETNILSRADLTRVYQDEMFYPDHARVLFGASSATEVCNLLDFDNDDRIPINALLCFFESRDVGLFDVTRLPETQISSVGSFISQLVMTVLKGTYLRFCKPWDERRTVWINTGHVNSLDFGLDMDDREFLRQRGYNACKSFLQNFVTKENIELKEDNSNFVTEGDSTKAEAEVENKTAQTEHVQEEI